MLVANRCPTLVVLMLHVLGQTSLTVIIRPASAFRCVNDKFLLMTLAWGAAVHGGV